MKICPTCGTENDAAAFFCATCFADLSRVCEQPAPPLPEPPQVPQEPVASDTAPHPLEDAGKTVLLADRTLWLRLDAKRVIAVKPGDVVGREGVGAEFLVGAMTVSRRHARILCEGDRWFVEDAGSTNGVWVDGVRLAKDERRPLHAGTKLALSQACVLTVETEERGSA